MVDMNKTLLSNLKGGIIMLLLAINSSHAFALGDTSKIPISRIIRHDDIKAELALCDKLDRKLDGRLSVGNNEEVNERLTKALFIIPHFLRNWIEVNDAEISTPNDKVRALKSVKDALEYFRYAIRTNEVKLNETDVALETYKQALIAWVGKKDVASIVANANYGIAKLVVQAIPFASEVKSQLDEIVYYKFITLNPKKILATIKPFANKPFADSLVVVAAKNNPEQFYSFAQSNDKTLQNLFERNESNIVKNIVQLAKTPNALLYFPFLDDIMSGRQQTADLQKFIGTGEQGYDSLGYYKQLVKTAIAYSRRMAAPLLDTPVAYYGSNGLIKTLETKAKQHFVKHINDLHNSPTPVRMRSIQPLTVEELYYMIVLTEDEIFTSSYRNSFGRMMQLMGTKPKGDSLLKLVNFDFFRKFIKMAANYNKLDTFLKTMPATRSEMLMTAFVKNLDKGNLENAVDVADSYASITNKSLRSNILNNIRKNEAESIANQSSKGKIVYGLLNTIFTSIDDSTINLTREIGIPPINEVANGYAQSPNGKIVEQVFFYGDEDGKAFYPRFKNGFANANWKIVEKKEWIEIAAVKGNVMLYVNKPLDNDANLDDTAQVHLGNYLLEQGIKPNVVVHRGHSYWLDRTMARMPGDAKIVLLGSCGGYKNLNKILEINPDAHIISTKEIGAGDINTPLLTYMNNVFNAGQDLNWPKMWATLSKSFSTDPSKPIRESWESYIPPNKNLGAIFLKAYALKEYE
jgi:hypothetical protein